MGVLCDLVDLVKDEDGVAGVSLLDAFDDTSGHRSYIGSAMTSDLGLVMQSSE